MKTALAVVCSLLLLGTLFVRAGVTGASGLDSAQACCCEIRCCTADAPQSEPSPVSTAPSSFSLHFLAPAAGGSIWTLPEPEASFPIPSPILFRLADVPLYARNCTLLI